MSKKPTATAGTTPLLRNSPDGMARVLGTLCALGGIFIGISVLLPHPGNSGMLWAIAAALLLSGAFLVTAASHLHPWAIRAVLAAYVLAIDLAVYAAGIAAGLYSALFVWLVLFSAYYFGRKLLAGYLIWLLGTYGTTLILLGTSAGYAPVTRWMFTSFVLTTTGVLTGWLVTRRDMAENSAKRFFDLSGDILCTTHPDGHFVDVNHAWFTILGFTPDEVRAKPFEEMVHPDDRERTIAEAARIFEGGDTVSFENRYRSKDGRWRWLRWSASKSAVDGLQYARATDITVHKEFEAEREQLMAQVNSEARTDSLTALANRRAFDDDLKREMARSLRDGSELYLALIDLDHFKAFNDAHGHTAGDEMLRDAASAWVLSVRAGDILARYGGEEFACILPNLSASGATEVVERLRAATPEPLTCSAGIARWNFTDAAEVLIDNADSALYAAKDAGRDRQQLHAAIRSSSAAHRVRAS